MDTKFLKMKYFGTDWKEQAQARQVNGETTYIQHWIVIGQDTRT